ncbi:uncharacterized protein KGF55_000445, partial [Candida pseudojiufengensis]|uniref:uncharacterized protein n=1 Tax=Candida pseudojiufengensis TaxID=497109 RepID=UPI002225A85D
MPGAIDALFLKLRTNFETYKDNQSIQSHSKPPLSEDEEFFITVIVPEIRKKYIDDNNYNFPVSSKLHPIIREFLRQPDIKSLLYNLHPHFLCMLNYPKIDPNFYRKITDESWLRKNFDRDVFDEWRLKFIEEERAISDNGVEVSQENETIEEDENDNIVEATEEEMEGIHEETVDYESEIHDTEIYPLIRKKGELIENLESIKREVEESQKRVDVQKNKIVKNSVTIEKLYEDLKKNNEESAQLEEELKIVNSNESERSGLHFISYSDETHLQKMHQDIIGMNNEIHKCKALIDGMVNERSKIQLSINNEGEAYLRQKELDSEIESTRIKLSSMEQKVAIAKENLLNEKCKISKLLGQDNTSIKSKTKYVNKLIDKKNDYQKKLGIKITQLGAENEKVAERVDRISALLIKQKKLIIKKNEQLNKLTLEIDKKLIKFRKRKAKEQLQKEPKKRGRKPKIRKKPDNDDQSDLVSESLIPPVSAPPLSHQLFNTKIPAHARLDKLLLHCSAPHDMTRDIIMMEVDEDQLNKFLNFFEKNHT